MRKLYLHIGSHKTGTTAVQMWLHENTPVLYPRGIRDLRSEQAAHVHHHLDFVDHTSVFPAGYCVRDPALFAAELVGLDAPITIASSENFSFIVGQEQIDALAMALHPHFDEIRIIAYLRRQDRHAVSHHMEGARLDRPPEWQLFGHGLAALPEVNPLQSLYLDYNARLQKWENAFGYDAMTVRVYDRATLLGSDIITDFAQAVGISTEGCTPTLDTNVSLDRVKSRIGHLANVIIGDQSTVTSLMWALPNTRNVLRPTRAEARAFLEPYRASNRALNARLAISPLPDLFSDDFDDLPELPQTDWSDAEVTTALRTVMEIMEQRHAPGSIPPVDDLRAAVVALAPRAPLRAMSLLQAALVQRPTGKVLLQMQAKLSAWLDSDRTQPVPNLEE